MYEVQGFLTDAECQRLQRLASKFMMIRSPVTGEGNGVADDCRTSSTCFLAREKVAWLCAKATALTNKPMEHMELPQVGHYSAGQEYQAHQDAFDVTTEHGVRFCQNGGQRLCTVLIYLNDVPQGGCTHFPLLNNLRVAPQKGKCVVFFPSFANGTIDKRMLHAAEPAVPGAEKWVSQLWIREGEFHGLPSEQIAPDSEEDDL